MLPNSSQQLNPQESHTIFIQRSNQCTDPTIRVYYCTVYQGEPIFCINKKAFSRLFSCYVASSPKGDHFKHKKKCIQKNPTSFNFCKILVFSKNFESNESWPKIEKGLRKSQRFFPMPKFMHKVQIRPTLLFISQNFRSRNKLLAFIHHPYLGSSPILSESVLINQQTVLQLPISRSFLFKKL